MGYIDNHRYADVKSLTISSLRDHAENFRATPEQIIYLPPFTDMQICDRF